MHTHQQRWQRHPWQVDVKTGPAAVMAIGGAVLPHPQMVAKNLDLRTRIVTQPRRIAGKGLGPFPPAFQTSTATWNYFGPGFGIAHL